MRFRFYLIGLASIFLFAACEHKAVKQKASAVADSVTQVMDQALNQLVADTVNNADSPATQSSDSNRHAQKVRAAFRENLKRLKQELKENQEQQ